MNKEHPYKKYCPDAFLAEGEHEGFQWAVLHNGMGFRCGYVCIPENHPWFEESDLNVEVHGGITYSQSSHDGSWWIGFDCAHSSDAPDPDLPGYDRIGGNYCDGRIKTQSYVERECKHLCNQAKEAVA